MTVSDQALLRDWDLLQTEVMPHLLSGKQQRGPLRSWSIGSIEDAVSIAVAYRHAGGETPRSTMESYATVDRQGEMGFRAADLSRVPDGSREYFVHEERRWVVDERIAEHVLLDDPSDPVDLVTVRAGGERAFDAALGQVRQGGQLLVMGPDLSRPIASAALEPVVSLSSGAVFRKLSPTTAKVTTATGQPENLARERSQRKLIESHTKLAASLARRFSHHGEAADDLQQVAMLALVKAAKRFDPGRDTRFATYATTSILGELKRHFRDKSWTMRVPRNLQETYLSVKQARDELTQTLGAEPSTGQIAEKLGCRAEDVSEALGAGDNFWAASLEGRFPDEGGIEIPDIDGCFDQALDRLHMQRRITTLDDEERLVLRRLYFDECTQREVAAEIGVSQMQVSRLQARALAKLRN